MKQYETYKDSGIEWIGQIPEGWKCLPMKHGLTINNGKDYKGVQSDNGYPVIGSGGPFAFATEYLHNGEAVLLGRKGTIDRPMYINEKFWTVDTMFYAIPKSGICCKYMYYQSLTIPFGLYSTNTALPSMTQLDLANNPMCFPPLSEQQAITSYLDHKVAQIDSAIAEKEQMLHDLKAYRSAIISEAVTKGLDKNVEMKDSGVEWIGMIPQHWHLNRLKYFSSVSTGTTPSTSIEKYWDNATEDWYTPSDFNEDDIHLDSSSRKVSKAAFNEAACRVFKEGAVLIVGIGATLGKVGISNRCCSANQQINAIEFKEIVEPLFGAYYLSSIKKVMNSVANSATLAIMNQSVTGDLPFLCPPIEEQNSIIAFLEEKTTTIRASIGEIQSQIADLKAYKSSIITEAVTGKVDLRGWNPNNDKK